MPTLAQAPARPRLVLRLAAIELGAVLLEGLWVAVPVAFAAAQWKLPLGVGPASLTLAAALWLACVLRGLDRLRPVLRVLGARSEKRPIAPDEADAAQRALIRLPLENGTLRFLSWLAVGGAALALANPTSEQLPLALALGTWVLWHAAGAAAVRALVVADTLARLRASIFPTLEAMRVWSRGYRAWLFLLALAVLAGGHTLWILLGMSLPGMVPQERAVLGLYAWPVLLVGLASSTRSLFRRTRAIEAYFDVTMRSPGTRGPARDEPKAISAFLSAQALPYRLGGYQAFVLLLGGVGAVAASRRMLGLGLGPALALLAGLAVVVALSAPLGVLFFRQTLRPLMRHLGSRHALPVADIRSRVGLGPKLMVLCFVLCGSSAALVALYRDVAPDGLGWALGAVGLGALGIVVLVGLSTREIVAPIQALEDRAEEMSRGELARPLPPSGEADEIGRLAMAFEEMRRALRDRLRSTESINVDLEREVRRRTEALEQRNAELHEALEKLRRAQDNLVRSEKLASMGRLVAGVAHEINNPVNAIINSLGPLEDTLGQIAAQARTAELGELGRLAQEMLAVVKRGAGRTKAIVQALHNYSRGEETVTREVNLRRSIDDTLDLLRHQLRHVEVIREIEEGASIVGYPGQIDQILMNLLVNAAQALGEKGGVVRVGTRRRTGAVELFVEDNGPGIPPELRTRIFDPFFTTKQVGEGSGLGLSIVHGIVDRHGGTIDVESVPGHGTTFRLTFPAPGQGVIPEGPAAAPTPES